MMNRSLAAVVAVILFGLTFGATAAEKTGIQLGWSSNNGLLLLSELNCVACHRDGSGNTPSLPVPPKQAPRLGDVGRRVTPQYLRAFLADPQKVKRGTSMPDMLHASLDREATIDSLVHYLVSLGGPMDQRTSGSSLTQIERGRALYHTIGCVACHAPFDPPPQHKIDPTVAALRDELEQVEPEAASSDEKSAYAPIPLGDLATKTTVDVLADFLVNPLHVRPSGRMPAMNLQAGEARMIAAYLLRDQYTDKATAPGVGLDLAYYPGNWKLVPDFESLTPTLETDAKSFDIKSIEIANGKVLKSNFALRYQGIIDVPRDGSYKFWTKSDDGSLLFIDGKKVVDNDGIHPPQEKQSEIELTKGRHTFELGFVQGGGGFELSVFWQTPGSEKREAIPAGVLLHASAAMIPRGIADFEVDAHQAGLGKKLFTSLGCASCHDTSNRDDPQRVTGTFTPAKPLSELDPQAAGGCLSDAVSEGRPRFGLNRSQLESLRKALSQRSDQTSPEATIDHRMTALNCYACHRRKAKGGPDRSNADYFVYEKLVDFGDEGRLPPALTEVGAKLTEAGFEHMLLRGQRYRTFMATRMPQYGKPNVGDLPEVFANADAGRIRPHKPDFSSRLVDDGRQLVGKQKLACINCHAWDSLRLPGAEGLDLLAAAKRLQPGWFQELLQDPQQLRPGTRMPTSWPNGQSFFGDIQEGDMHKQIDAIWAYLSVGEKGGPPPGLSPDDNSLLVPVDKPVVFRAFLDRVSAHAILVGFRQRTHFAFDANRIRMAVAWTGDFISTNSSWEGRAGQYARIPGNDVVWFPDGPPLARLASLDDAWPGDVPKVPLGSTRTPPGWQFRGYRYDKNRVPTFLYRMGAIDVEETPGTTFDQNMAVAMRRFQLSSNEKVEDLYLRVAVGDIVQAETGVFVVDKREHWRIDAAGTAASQIRVQGEKEELIVPVIFSAAPSGERYQADVTVTLQW